jgi:transcriptional regulator with XRE-family HTH domain
MPPTPPDESLGALLARTRLDTGKSQLRIAELLCATSGQPTVTRHEVSRWEREERIPNDYWLRWLATVLEITLDELERAAAVARERRSQLGYPAVTGHRRLVADDRCGSLSVLPGARLTAERIDTLRRMDDLVGGADLGRIVDQELGRTLRRIQADPSRPGQRALLPLVAELAQLAGWVAADAGQPVATARAHRIGLRAATAAGDDPLAGHVIATLAHLSPPEDPRLALAQSRAGYARAGRRASAGTRSLLLHRVAFAAARVGDRRTCERSLAEAERVFDHRDPAQEPGWTYWFDETELAAMTGRCYVALGRPRLAEPLLRGSLDGGRVRLRPWALYAAWLAGAQLDAGDVDAACATAARALLATVRVGSVRALRQVTSLHPRLRALRDVPAVAGYARLWRAAGPYLPDRTVTPDRQPSTGLGAGGTHLAGCG